ncbi:MAG: FecR family protein [Candidatus Marinimicrobia bacterium]|nr:FecR family protein [Candidatus Neomarinimicrobiota bacterium]
MNYIKKGLLLIFIFSLLIGGDRIAVATKVIGSVEYVRGKDFAKSVKKGHIIESGDKITTAKGGFVALLFIDDKSALKVKENSEVIISGNKNNQAIAKRIGLKGGTIRAQVGKKQNRDFIVQTTVSVASVKGTDFWVVSDNNNGDSVIGIEGVIQLTNKISGDKIDIPSGITGLATKDGQLQSFNTDPKTIPKDPSGDNIGNQKLKIEFKDANGKKKTLVIEYK